MMSYPPLFLRRQEERRLKAGHLWIYSNEIDTSKSPLKQFQAGELVQVYNDRQQYLGIGYINPNTLLAARLLSNQSEEINEYFFQTRIRQALVLRDRIFAKPYYRLIYGESDGLPGLIVDRYGDILVAQITTAGMEKMLPLILAALQSDLKPTHILLRNDSQIRQLEGLTLYTKVASGNDFPTSMTVIENDVPFEIVSESGQKTGWFYDHRDNRARLRRYVKNKKILDVFSYVGGWGIQAAAFGAQSVMCVDSSAQAIQQVLINAALNQVSDKVTTICADAFEALKNLQIENQSFDVIILDPPAFIKKRKDQAAGEAAYQRLNELALNLLQPGGILISASCSLHLGADTLLDLIRRASLKTKQSVKILERGFQGPDHPVHPAIPETAYLKAFYAAT